MYNVDENGMSIDTYFWDIYRVLFKDIFNNRARYVVSWWINGEKEETRSRAMFDFLNVVRHLREYVPYGCVVNKKKSVFWGYREVLSRDKCV